MENKISLTTVSVMSLYMIEIKIKYEENIIFKPKRVDLSLSCIV